MSELMNIRSARKDFRWHLLTTASALALVASSALSASAEVSDGQDHPTVWIELGGQLERQTAQGDVFPVPFVVNDPDSLAFKPVSPLHLERPSLYSNGFEGSISFEPDHSDWVFSAGIRYGRSARHNDIHNGRLLTAHQHYTRLPQYYYTPSSAIAYRQPEMGTFVQQVYEFAGTQINQSQSHTIADFTAGSDVGLGVLGRNASSTLNFGVRFAQFISKSSTTIHARPDAHFSNPCNPNAVARFGPLFPSLDLKFCFPHQPLFHTRTASSESYRDFRGIGPSISWKASVPVLGNPDDEALMLDWGVNGAVLFGRQRANGSHQTSGSYGGYAPVPTHYSRSASFDRSRHKIIPNIGGMIGASLKFPNAKVSIGYRGDFFFGAMDTGFDERKTKTVGFYGPFATISFGFGG